MELSSTTLRKIDPWGGLRGVKQSMWCKVQKNATMSEEWSAWGARVSSSLCSRKTFYKENLTGHTSKIVLEWRLPAHTDNGAVPWVNLCTRISLLRALISTNLCFAFSLYWFMKCCWTRISPKDAFPFSGWAHCGKGLFLSEVRSKCSQQEAMSRNSMCKN
jgi:hypothetical protein